MFSSHDLAGRYGRLKESQYLLIARILGRTVLPQSHLVDEGETSWTRRLLVESMLKVDGEHGEASTEGRSKRCFGNKGWNVDCYDMQGVQQIEQQGRLRNQSTVQSYSFGVEYSITQA